MRKMDHYRTWTVALSAALQLADRAPLDHELVSVNMGTFAAGAGWPGEHYAILVFSYTLGEEMTSPDTKARRTERIVKAWDEARARERVPA